MSVVEWHLSRMRGQESKSVALLRRGMERSPVLVQDFRVGQERPGNGYCDNRVGAPANEKQNDVTSPMRLGKVRPVLGMSMS